VHVLTTRGSWRGSHQQMLWTCATLQSEEWPLSADGSRQAGTESVGAFRRLYDLTSTTTSRASQLPIAAPLNGNRGSCGGSQTDRAASGAGQHHRLPAARTPRRPQARLQVPWGLPPSTRFRPCSHSWLQRLLSNTRQRPWPLHPGVVVHSGHRMSHSPGTLR
jgi:hypothetical protein